MVTRVRPNVVDSSAWLSYFATAIEDVRRLVVPAVCLLEVFKVVVRQRGEGDALQAVAIMQQGDVVALDAALALGAARAGIDYRLPFADGIVLATARAVGGVVCTQDEHFEGLPDVRFFPKRRAS